MDHDAALETDLFREHLGLVEFCSSTSTKDGMPRTPGKLLITTQGEAWKVELIDPDGRRSIRVLAATLDDAIEMATLFVRSKSPPWHSISVARSLV